MARQAQNKVKWHARYKNKITNSKLEVRMSKIDKRQIRNTKQIQIVKNLTTATFQTKPLRIPVLDFGVLGFVWLRFVSDFDIRILGLSFGGFLGR
jgi:hypothetical protein